MAVSREVASYQGQQEIVDAINGFTLSGVAQKAVWFDSVSSMQRADIPAGATAATRGYTTVNDGGNAFYYIREKTQSDVEDGGSIIFLDNENVAELITDGTVCPEQFGAKGDGATDDSTQINNAITYSRTHRLTLLICKFHYLASELVIDSYTHIKGASKYAGFTSHSDINLLHIVTDSIYVIVENLRLYCEDKTTGICINAGYSRWLRLVNIEMARGKYGLYFDGPYYSSVDLCNIHSADVGVYLTNSGAISFYALHLNVNNTNFQIGAHTSSVSITGSCMENPQAIAQLVCDGGSLAISDTYIGDTTLPSLILNSGSVKINNTTQHLHKIIQNGGNLNLDNYSIVWQNYGAGIAHTGGLLCIGENYVATWRDFETSIPQNVSMPIKQTYSPAGNFKDLSLLTVPAGITLVSGYMNYMGGTAIKVYGLGGGDEIKIPFTIPADLVNQTLIVKLKAKCADNPYFNQKLWMFVEDAYDIDRDTSYASPIVQSYNYISWAKAIAFNETSADGTVYYVPVKVKVPSGFIVFRFAWNADVDANLCWLEYCVLVNPIDAYSIAKYE